MVRDYCYIIQQQKRSFTCTASIDCLLFSALCSVKATRMSDQWILVEVNMLTLLILTVLETFNTLKVPFWRLLIDAYVVQTACPKHDVWNFLWLALRRMEKGNVSIASLQHCGDPLNLVPLNIWFAVKLFWIIDFRDLWTKLSEEQSIISKNKSSQVEKTLRLLQTCISSTRTQHKVFDITASELVWCCKML